MHVTISQVAVGPEIRSADWETAEHVQATDDGQRKTTLGKLSSWHF